MKKLSLILSVIILVIFSSKEIKANSPHYMQGYFYSNLSPYGNWISIDYGVYAWRPTIISRTWAPYKMGRWVYTDYGWYWDSYEPFGFIVYHYGRWHYDDYYGWIWIPDYEWGPAWVEWRYDDFYIGWAPLPPYAVFRISIGIVYTHTYVIPISHWHFVKFRYFGDPYVYNYYIPEKIKYRVHSNTKYRNEYRYSNGRVRNEGVDFDYVRQRAGDLIRKRDVLITDDPRNLDNSRRRDSDRITTFIADREKIQKDRETLRNVEVVRNERRTSLDLSRVELSETRNVDQRIRNTEDKTINRDSDRQNRQSRNDNSKEIERKEIERRESERRELDRKEMERRESERRELDRKEMERRESERRELDRKEMERRESERRELDRKEMERRNNQIIEQRRNENRENETNRERNQNIERQNTQNQREQERRNNSWTYPNTEQQRTSRTTEERKIEQYKNQREDNRELRNNQRNESPRNDDNRENVIRERRQDIEQRSR